MKGEYFAFLDAASKFAVLSYYYSQEVNFGAAVSSSFGKDYYNMLSLLKKATKEDFSYLLSKSCTLYLSFIDEMWDDITEFKELYNRDDSDLTPYDRAYDYLTMKDTFTDLVKDLNKISQIILSNRKADSHPRNSKYDMSTAQQEKITPEEE